MIRAGHGRLGRTNGRWGADGIGEDPAGLLTRARLRRATDTVTVVEPIGSLGLSLGLGLGLCLGLRLSLGLGLGLRLCLGLCLGLSLGSVGSLSLRLSLSLSV